MKLHHFFGAMALVLAYAGGIAVAKAHQDDAQPDVFTSHDTVHGVTCWQTTRKVKWQPAGAISCLPDQWIQPYNQALQDEPEED